MSPGTAFLLCFVGFMAFVGGVVATVINIDRVVVTLLRLVNAPVYEDARMIAGSIYRHPEQWTLYGGDALKHETIGMIHQAGYIPLLHIDNSAFGSWKPNMIERRIIGDAVEWHHRTQVRSVLRKFAA
jgi:hypothetical protein